MQYIASEMSVGYMAQLLCLADRMRMAERNTAARHTIVCARRERQIVCFQVTVESLRQKNNRGKSVIFASSLFLIS